jgi:hypothetical protein
MARDGAADIVIETLALSEAELLGRVATLEADVQIYRELAVASFDALQGLTLCNRRLRDSGDRLRDENRALRAQILRNAGADDTSHWAVG